MHSGIRIALVGDFNETQKAHQAIPRALAAAPEASAEGVWVPTDSIANGSSLSEFDGIWCVPGMPYRSADGALRAIRRARESRTPFLGTSAGFQYALIEHARNVLGMADADHQKTNPKAATPLISPLGCALVGVKARVRLSPGSAIRSAYGVAERTVEYSLQLRIERPLPAIDGEQFPPCDGGGRPGRNPRRGTGRSSVFRRHAVSAGVGRAQRIRQRVYSGLRTATESPDESRIIIRSARIIRSDAVVASLRLQAHLRQPVAKRVSRKP